MYYAHGFLAQVTLYINQATLPPLSLGGVGAGFAGADTRRRASARGGSRHPQSIRAHTAALRSVAQARAICTHAMTTRSRGDGRDSSSYASPCSNPGGPIIVLQHCTTSAIRRHAAPAHNTLATPAPAVAPLVTAQPRDVWMDTAAAKTLIPPAGMPRPMLNFCLSSMKATLPITMADIPHTICSTRRRSTRARGYEKPNIAPSLSPVSGAADSLRRERAATFSSSMSSSHEKLNEGPAHSLRFIASPGGGRRRSLSHIHENTVSQLLKNPKTPPTTSQNKQHPQKYFQRTFQTQILK